MIHDGTGSEWGGNGWYLVDLGQYGVVLDSTWWYWVSIILYCLVLSGTRLVVRTGLLCLYNILYICIYVYIEKSGDLVGTDGQTNKQGKIGLLSHWTMEG